MAPHCGLKAPKRRIFSWLGSSICPATPQAYTFGTPYGPIAYIRASGVANLNIGGAPRLGLHTAERGGMPVTLTDFQKVADAEMVTTDRHLTF